MKSGIAKGLIIGAMVFGVFGFVKNADAHPCRGIRGAHCRCQVVYGSTALTSVEDHSRCYNQQTNTGANSDCAQYCKGWGNASSTQSAAKSALRNIPSACNTVSVNLQYEAGTNGYRNAQTLQINTGGHEEFYLLSPTQGCGKKCVGK